MGHPDSVEGAEMHKSFASLRMTNHLDVTVQFFEHGNAALADCGVGVVLTDMGRVIPAAVALRPFGFLYFDVNAAGAIAGAHYIRAVAPIYGVPVVLHTDHCAKKLLPWLDGMLDEDEKHFKKHGVPLFRCYPSKHS